MVDSIVNVLQKRDGISYEEAEAQWQEFQEIFNELLETGESMETLEDEFTSFFGLEPDYLLEFIC